jgi:hypothetical protein
MPVQREQRFAIPNIRIIHPRSDLSAIANTPRASLAGKHRHAYE